MKICIVIPARLASSRLPQKVILPIAGKPMIQWVYEAAQKVRGINKIIIATDSNEVRDVVTAFGGFAVLTSPQHVSGTDRVGEVAAGEKEMDVFINIQGDEPLIDPQTIQQMVDYYRTGGSGIVTLYETITDEKLIFDYNIVKLTKTNSGKVLYFSRSPIPALRDFPYKDWIKKAVYYRHIGMYGFDKNTLHNVCALSPGILEQTEMLEQLRWMENGYEITGLHCNHHAIGVDTAEDLAKAEKRLLERLG